MVARLPTFPGVDGRVRPAPIDEPLVLGLVRPPVIDPERVAPLVRLIPEIPAREGREPIDDVVRRPLSRLRPSPATRGCGR